jgi:hypothetical protein
MKTYGEVDVEIQFFWPRHKLEVSGQLHAPSALSPPGKEPPGTHWTRGWLGPRAGLDNMEKRKFLAAAIAFLISVLIWARTSWQMLRGILGPSEKIAI